MTDVEGLVEFLTARLDEAEARARATGRWMGASWRVEVMPTGPAGTAWVRGGEGAEGPVMDRFAEFVASNDPAFVLADIAAKRKMVEFWSQAYMNPADTQFAGAEWDKVRRNGLWTLKLLALPFSGHRDYRQEWQPS